MSEERVRILGYDAEVARTFFARAKGLIGRRGLPPGRGLLILKCNSIHMFFMRFAIDAIFLDAHDNVVKRVRNVRPWRPFVWGGWRARKVLEVAAGDPGAGGGIAGA